jgi:ABC-type transport system involved in multi-copper enzyme maturation permease subunit
VSGSLQRISTLRWETWKEIIQNRWFQVCASGLLCFVVAGRLLTDLPLGSSAPKLIFDFGQVTITMVSGFVMVLVLTHQIANELQNGVIYGYVVRRVTRGEYLFGKLLGCWLALLMVVLVTDFVLAILVNAEVLHLVEMGVEAESPTGTGWLQLFLMQALHLLVLGSLTVFMVSLSSSFLFAALTTLIIWVTGLFLGGISMATPVGLGGFILEVVRWIIPRFGNWDFSDQIWYSGSLEISVMAISLLFAALYGGLAMFLAVGIFNRRDL